MSTYLTLPHRGHVKQVFHVFGNLKANPKRMFCFDPQNPAINERSFNAHDWYDFYQDTKEAIPKDTPTPRRNVVSTFFLWTLTMKETGIPGNPRPGS